MDSEEDLQFLALLRAQHRFPGPFTMKVLCRNTAGIVDLVLDAACGPEGLPRPADPPGLKCSSGGRFVSVTLDLHLDDARQVLAVYRSLRAVPGVISCF